MFYLWCFAAGLIHIPIYSFPWSIELLLGSALGCVVLARLRLPFVKYFAYVLLGMAVGSWNLQRLCDAQLPPAFDHTSAHLTFKIVSIPKNNPDSAVFLAHVDEVHCAATTVCPDIKNRKVRLSWYRPKTEVAAGQVWRATVKLRRPRGFINPHGFDYHAWLLGQDVVATGSVAKDAVAQGQSRVWAWYREALSDSLLRLSVSENRRFWAALLIGEQSGISQTDWSTLQATGTVHLLVISGMHIGLVAGWCFLLGGFAVRLATFFHRSSNALVGQFIPPLMACVGAGGYAALAGFSIPTVRALVACLALMACRMSGVNLSGFTLLGMALVIVGICEPLAWENAGFWLSFLAVGLLFYVFSARLRQNAFAGFLRTQPIMALGLMLPLLMLGQPFSLTGPVANLVAVPVVSFLLVPGLLIAASVHTVFPVIAEGLLQLMDVIFNWLWIFLQWLESWPAALWWPAKPFSFWALALIAGGTLLVLAPAGLAVRGLGFLWLAAGIFVGEEPDYLLRVTVMDVGQGQAVVLQTPTETWLYDAGPAYSDQFDAGSRIVVPYLRRIGVRQLNMMVSHADLDHAGGVAGVTDAMQLNRVFYGEPLGDLPEGEFCHQGQAWQAGGVKFFVLWPPAGRHNSGNDSSCALLVEFESAGDTVRLLLPGDISKVSERRLLGQLPPIDWLLAPHHGSRSSSSYHLLYRARPRHVVFSAGYRNRYGHPHPKIEDRYREIGAELYNTAEDGALVFTWTQRGMEIERARERRAKLWHRLPD